MDEPEQDQQADARLAERLIRGGVGLRHARRVLRELRDHREDIVERMVAQGWSRAAAGIEARQLLGIENHLVAQMTARPELRSRARRFAWLLFVLGPLPMVCALGLLATFAAMAILQGIGLVRGNHLPPDLEVLTYLALMHWVVPLAVGLMLCRTAARRRIPAVWPISAMVLVALSSAAISYYDNGAVATLAFGYRINGQRAVMLFSVLGLAYLLLDDSSWRSRPINTFWRPR